MLYLLEKAEKSPQCWGLRPQPPIRLRRLGAPTPDPQQLVTFSQVTCYFLALLLRFLAIKLTTCYFILERRLVGPLISTCPPPPWIKPLVTPLSGM